MLLYILCLCVDFAFPFDSFVCAVYSVFAVFVIVSRASNTTANDEKLTSAVLFLFFSFSFLQWNKMEFWVWPEIIKTIKLFYNSSIYTMIMWNGLADEISKMPENLISDGNWIFSLKRWISSWIHGCFCSYLH